MLMCFVCWQPQYELADGRVEGWASVTGVAKDFTDWGPARETQEREGAETVPIWKLRTGMTAPGWARS